MKQLVKTKLHNVINATCSEECYGINGSQEFLSKKSKNMLEKRVESLYDKTEDLEYRIVELENYIRELKMNQVNLY